MAYPWGCLLAGTRVLKRLEDVRDNKKKVGPIYSLDWKRLADVSEISQTVFQVFKGVKWTKGTGLLTIQTVKLRN